MKLFARLILILALAAPSFTQQPAKDVGDQRGKDEPSKKEVLAGVDGITGNFFKLAFVMYELDDGKRTNQRDYMLVGRTDNQPSSIRVSTRVPVYTEQNKMTYVDAGLTIRCSLKEQVDRRLQVHCDIEISSFVRPDQIASSGSAGPAAPVLRTTRTESWVLLTLGKPAAFTTVDDVNSAKRMQIEVAATKVD